MSFIILRFAKQKGNPARPIEAHHERKKEHYKSNPDIVQEQSKYNIHLISPANSYQAEIETRIKESGCRIRKDSTKFVDTLITASPEFFKQKSQAEIQDFFEKALDFMKTKIRADCIFSAVIHLDEKTPHMHLCFVPLTPDNRLSAKEILGNRAKLSKWQDEFHKYMAAFYPELQRGISGQLTNRKHIPSYIYKSAKDLQEMEAEIKRILQSTTLFNAGKNTQKALAALEHWVPMVQTFETQINMLEKSLTEEQKNKALFQSELENSKQQNSDLFIELSALKVQMKKMKKLYHKVPPEIRAEIETKQSPLKNK